MKGLNTCSKGGANKWYVIEEQLVQEMVVIELMSVMFIENVIGEEEKMRLL